MAGKDTGAGDAGAVAAEVDRISALPLPALAAEVMMKGFGPGGPGGPGQPGTLEALSSTVLTQVDRTTIGRALTPAFTAKAASREQDAWLRHLVAEALQALEHASLIRVSWRQGSEHYTATRLGRTATDRTTIERILTDRGT